MILVGDRFGGERAIPSFSGMFSFLKGAKVHIELLFARQSGRKGARERGKTIGLLRVLGREGHVHRRQESGLVKGPGGRASVEAKRGTPSANFS